MIIFHAKKTVFVKKFDNVFSKGKIKSSKEVKTIISWGMWRVSVMPMGRLSCLSTPVAGSVMAHARHAVFLIVLSPYSL